jgi:hypothetical protein
MVWLDGSEIRKRFIFNLKFLLNRIFSKWRPFGCTLALDLQMEDFPQSSFWYSWIAQTLLPLMERFFLFFLKSISCRIFDYSDLGGRSFCCERISAQGASAAHFVALVREQQRKGTQI